MASIFYLSDFHLSESTENNNIFQDSNNINITIEHLSNKMRKDDMLIIGGDMTDKCVAAYNEKIKQSTIELLCRLSRMERKIMFIPGNHDVCRTAVGDDPFDNNKYNVINEIISEVNKNVSKNKIESNISIDKAIVDTHILGKALVIGINSTYGLGSKDGPGSININSLENELEKLKNEKYCNVYNNYTKIVVLHHNLIVSIGENVEKDNVEGVYGNVNNGGELIKLLKRYNIHSVIMGHAHGNQSMHIENPFSSEDDGMYYYIGGSIGLQYKDTAPIFSRYSVGNDGKITSQVIYAYIRVHDEAKWILFEGEEVESVEETETIDTLEQGEDETSRNISNDISKSLLNYISDHSLLKTGHFSHSGKALLSWLDSTEFISNRKWLTKICEYMYTLFNGELEEADAFVGFGMKGTMLVNSIRAMYDDKFITFLSDTIISESSEPDKTIMEKTLDELKSKEKIVIFTDIFNTGTAINNMLVANKNVFAKKVVSIMCIVNLSDNDSKEQNNKSEPISVTNELNCKLQYSLFWLLKMKSLSCTSGTECKNCSFAKDEVCKIN